MCSFDVVSLFTNVPLEKTIKIFAEALYHDDEVEPVCTTLSERSFCDLLRMVTSGVEFSFDNKIYLQKDGVAMGSPLRPVLADIFVGWCKSHIPEDAWPATYCRFVDDAFSFFERFQDIDQFLEILNNLHPALKFTCEHENEDQLPYLDVLVEKNTANRSISTSVYRKPTFTGLYNTWDSFCATKYKINTVKNLVQRSHRICSPSKLDQELEKLRSIFTTNGYPLDLLAHLVKRKQEQDRPMGPKRCPVYLRLPWKGPWSSVIPRTIGQTAQAAYNAVNVNCVYTTSRAFNLRKDVLPSHSLNNLIYQSECRNCASRYVGRTAQRLSSRLRQQVPLNILVTDEAGALRPKRGRPPANPTTEETPTSADTACTVWLVPQNRTSVLRKPTALRKIMTVLAQVVQPLMLWPVMTTWVPTLTISLKEQGPIYHVAVKAQKWWRRQWIRNHHRGCWNRWHLQKTCRVRQASQLTPAMALHWESLSRGPVRRWSLQISPPPHRLQ